MSSPNIAAEGVTNPSIDDLLTKTDSKYKLVLYSAKRARQINAYYSQLGEGLLEYVGPLVDTHVQEKPLSIALREINEDLLTCEDVDPAELAAEEAAEGAALERRRSTDVAAVTSTPDEAVPTGTRPLPSRRRSCSASPAASRRTRPATLLRLFTESGHDVTRRADGRGAGVRRRAHLGGAVGQAGRHRRLDRRPRGAARADRAVRRPGRGRPGHRRPAGEGRPRPGRRPAHQHPAHRPLPGRVRPGDAHRDVGAPRHPGATSPPCARAAPLVIEPAEGRLTGADTGKGRLPEPAEIFEACLDVLARGVAGGPTWPAATSWSRPAAPASTSTRCASSATAPPACRATRWPAPPPPAAPRSRWSRANVALPDPAGVKVVRVETTAQLRDEVVAAAARPPTPW